jgi:hypothetical protein
MWLLYLRFDNRGMVKTYHVRTRAKADVDYLVKLAERHGLAKHEQLVEYAAFTGTIKVRPMITPHFHFYEHAEFVRRWDEAERGEPPVAAPVTTRLTPP